MAWSLLGGIAAGASYLVGRRWQRNAQRDAAARAAGLEPRDDIAHLPHALQRTALWTLSDGGFERRVVHGVVASTHGDIAITAFDLETLRSRRGEWAFLPVEAPFRIAGVETVVVCEIARRFPHVLCKRAGRGDNLIDDEPLDRLTHVMKGARDLLAVSRRYPAELPRALPTAAHHIPPWRIYTHAHELELGAVLHHATRRDVALELIDTLVVLYVPHVADADPFADLIAMARELADALLAAFPHLTPRGIDVTVP